MPGLNPSEIVQCKKELGYVVLNGGPGQAYLDGYLFLFEQAVIPFVDTQAESTSSTVVAAATTPSPVTLTLADASLVPVGSIVVVDIDTRQEKATVQSKSGNNITLLLSKVHTGTYPVAVESGVTIVRALLKELSSVSTTIASLRSRVGIKKAEDIEFFGGGATLAAQGIDPLTQVFQLREFWRDELSSALGVRRLNGPNQGGGASISMY